MRCVVVVLSFEEMPGLCCFLHQPTMLPPHRQKPKLSLSSVITVISDTSHISRPSFPTNTQRTNTAQRRQTTFVQCQDKTPTTAIAHANVLVRQCERIKTLTILPQPKGLHVTKKRMNKSSPRREHAKAKLARTQRQASTRTPTGQGVISC